MQRLQHSGEKEYFDILCIFYKCDTNLFILQLEQDSHSSFGSKVIKGLASNKRGSGKPAAPQMIMIFY